VINKIKYGELNWTISNKSIYKKFDDSEETETWGRRIYKDWGIQYKEVMHSAKVIITSGLISAPIECYCGYAYREVNEFLRHEVDNESNTYREMAELLSIILCSAPRIPCDLIVYRLVCDEFIQEMINKNKSEYPTPIQEKGFMSTSLLKNIVNEQRAYNNHKNLLKIYLDKNSIGIYVNAITRRSEEEMLLFPNSYLGMIEYPYRDSTSGKIVYECKLINFY
jgi:hypothetical protein